MGFSPLPPPSPPPPGRPLGQLGGRMRGEEEGSRLSLVPLSHQSQKKKMRVAAQRGDLPQRLERLKESVTESL